MGRRIGLLILALALPIVSTSTSEASGDLQPGWILFDYVGGSTVAEVQLGATFGGPGVLGMEERNTEGGGSTGRVTWNGRHLEVVGGDASVSTLDMPLVVTFTTSLPADVIARVAFWSMSEDAQWWWSADLPADASLTYVSSATGGHYRVGDSPDAGAHAHAASPIATVAVSSASYFLEVEHGFVGYAGIQEGLHVLDDNLLATRPDGSRQTCPCKSPSGRYGDWGPGTYRLDWNGVSVGAQRTLLLGVDIDGLPPAFPPT